MASDNVRDAGSPEAVALQLAERIYKYIPSPSESEARNFWLDLYAECLQATRGTRHFGKNL